MLKKVTIIMPESASADDKLVALTEYLTKTVFKGEWQGGGLLGGEYGYGVNFENDTFMMHPFCWCEEEKCGWCYGDNPNFLYKPTGAKVWWYKWIGRSQEQEGKLPKNWYKKCVESLKEVEE